MRPAIEVIVNSGSGSVLAGETERSLRHRFIEHGVRANVHLAKTGAEIEQFAADAADSEAEVIVAGGGDGTISAVAKEVHRACTLRQIARYDDRVRGEVDYLFHQTLDHDGVLAAEMYV